jgi:hypothetical protein
MIDIDIQRLFSAVLIQVIKDLSINTNKLYAIGGIWFSDRIDIKRKAIEFFDTEDFVYVCDIAGYNSKYVLIRTKNLIKQAKEDLQNDLKAYRNSKRKSNL